MPCECCDIAWVYPHICQVKLNQLEFHSMVLDYSDTLGYYSAHIPVLYLEPPVLAGLLTLCRSSYTGTYATSWQSQYHFDVFKLFCRLLRKEVSLRMWTLKLHVDALAQLCVVCPTVWIWTCLFSHVMGFYYVWLGGCDTGDGRFASSKLFCFPWERSVVWRGRFGGPDSGYSPVWDQTLCPSENSSWAPDCRSRHKGWGRPQMCSLKRVLWALVVKNEGVDFSFFCEYVSVVLGNKMMS